MLFQHFGALAFNRRPNNSGQIIATSAEVTPNGALVRESTQMTLIQV